MSLYNVLLTVPNTPGSILSASATNAVLPSTFINTTQANVSSWSIPPIAKRVSAFLLSGQFVIGSAARQYTVHQERQWMSLLTQHASFPQKVGAHALISSINIRTQSGATLVMEPNYVRFVFNCEENYSSPQYPAADIGLQMHTNELGNAQKSPINSNQLFRNFIIRLMLPFNAPINLLTTGGLVIEIVWNNPQTVCTFPNLIFPVANASADSYYGQAALRPFCFHQLYDGIQTVTSDSDRAESAIYPLGKDMNTDPRLSHVQQVSLEGSGMKVSDVLSSLTFWVSPTLQLAVGMEVVTSPDSSTKYEAKRIISAIFPRTPGNSVALNLPISAYTAGMCAIRPLITTDTYGWGVYNQYNRRGTVSNNPQWLFNSTTPSLTYPLYRSSQTEYSSFISTYERLIMASDRFLQYLPLARREKGAGALYNFGKTAIAATSATLLMTTFNLSTYYPITDTVSNPGQTEVQSGEAPSYSVSLAGGAASTANTSEIYEVSSSIGPVLPSTIAAQTAAALFYSPDATQYRDFSRACMNAATQDSSVLPSTAFSNPVGRTYHDLRAPVTLRTALASGPGWTPRIHSHAIISQSTALVPPLAVSIASSNQTLFPNLTTTMEQRSYAAAGAATSLTSLAIQPLIKSIPYRHMYGKSPMSNDVQWRMDLDTYQTVTLTPQGITISPSRSYIPDSLNAVSFQSYPASQASGSAPYMRKMPVISVPPLYLGNTAYQWDSISMGNILASALYVPIGAVDHQQNPLAICDGSQLCVMPDLHAYASPEMTAANRFTYTKIGQASVVSMVQLQTPNGILRSTFEKEFMADSLLTMSPSDRAIYNQKYKGHGNLRQGARGSNYYIPDSSIYQDCRPHDRASIIPYRGYRGLTFNQRPSFAFPQAPVPAYAPNAIQGARTVAAYNPVPSLSAFTPSSALAALAQFPSDLISGLEKPGFLCFHPDQSYALRAALALPQVPLRQYIVEFDTQAGALAPISAGGGAFSCLQTDPHVEMAILASQNAHVGNPTARLYPSVYYGSAESAVVYHLVHNPENMPEITNLAYAEPIPVPIPAAITFDSYQTIESDSGANVLAPSGMYSDPAAATSPFAEGALSPSAYPLSIKELTIYNPSPYPLGGLDVDHISVLVRAGHYDSAHRSPRVPPLVQPKNALHSGPNEYSLSLFSTCASQGARSSAAALQALSSPIPIASTVTMYPLVDNVMLCSSNNNFGYPLDRIQQNALIHGALLQIPHNALFDNGQPYMWSCPALPSAHSYSVVTNGGVFQSLNFLAGYITPVMPARPVYSLTTPQNLAASYAISVHTALPAIHHSPSLQTLFDLSTSYPSAMCSLEIYTKNQLRNARMISLNFMFNSQPISQLSTNDLSFFLNNYISYGIPSGPLFNVGAAALACPQTEFLKNLVALNLYATPREYTQTVRMHGTNFYLLTRDGVMAKSFAFAN